MKTIRKPMLLMAAALGLGLVSTAALAAPDMGCDGWGRGRAGDPDQRAQMRQTRQTERLELLRNRLNLSLDQADEWQTFAAAHDAQREAMGGYRQNQPQREANTAEHFANRIQFMEERLAGMRAVAAAADSLYATLNAEQKAVLDDFFATRPGFGRGYRPN